MSHVVCSEVFCVKSAASSQRAAGLKQRQTVSGCVRLVAVSSVLFWVEFPGLQSANQRLAFKTLTLQLESCRGHPLHMDPFCVCVCVHVKIRAPSGEKYTLKHHIQS